MAFDPIDTAEIQVKKPVTRSLWQKVKDSLDFLNGRIGTIELQGLQNGSFEIDSDADGVPDNWTRSLYPGGLAALDALTVAHGAQSFQFTHPGGAGNGGGSLTSDYIPVSSSQLCILDFIHASSAGLRNLVEILYYNPAKVYVSGATIYAHTPASGGDFASFVASFTPPAGVGFMKVKLTGGHSSESAAGFAWFDGLRLNPPAWDIGYSMPFSIAESTAVSLDWVDVSTTTIITPVLQSPCILTFVAELLPSGVAGSLRFRIGAAYSDEFTSDGEWAPHTFTLPFQNVGEEIALVMQVKSSSGPASVSGRKTSSIAATLRFNL